MKSVKSKWCKFFKPITGVVRQNQWKPENTFVTQIEKHSINVDGCNLIKNDKLICSGAPRAPKALARGAPLIRDFGKPISTRKFGLVMTLLRPTDRPPVRTYAPPCKPM